MQNFRSYSRPAEEEPPFKQNAQLIRVHTKGERHRTENTTFAELKKPVNRQRLSTNVTLKLVCWESL